MGKERAAALLEYLQKWDFQLFPLMPIAEEDAEYILRILEQRERELDHKREYMRARAFIKGAKHE